MVVASLVFAVAVSASLSADEGSGTEPLMRPTRLSPIRTITIRQNGAMSSAGERADQCKAFKLSSKEIHEYIGKAAEVTQKEYFHTLDWSPCYASGKVVFKNGITGIWGIQQYRAGLLKLSNGRTLYLYCPRCRAKAFPSAEE